MKTFKIQSSEHFSTGKIASGDIVIMGLLCPHIVIEFFHPDGVHYKTECVLWESPAPQIGGDGPFQTNDQKFLSALENQFTQLHASLGFSEEVIAVQTYYSDYSSAYHFPNHFDDEDLVEEREEWLESKNHCFEWAEEYWLSEDGEIESS